MRKKISHLLILIYRARINAEKRYAEKTTQKMDFTGVEIAWVDMKSNEYPLFYIREGNFFIRKSLWKMTSSRGQFRFFIRIQKN